MTLDDRLRDLILRGDPFTADDLTDNGTRTVAGDHDPNGKQNAIGAAFRRWHKNRWIETTGEIVKSRAPHRKGGMIQQWAGTVHGHDWATGQGSLL